jgi:hypothetical protein
MPDCIVRGWAFRSYNPSLAAMMPSKTGFLARLDALGSKLLYAAYFGGNEMAGTRPLARG